jgi:polar amino acid transport system substrate-binding protein
MKRALVLALALGLPALAWGACSRVLQAPVSALGLSITITGQAVGGYYPELFRSLGEKSDCFIKFSAVPRARQEALFENGKSDLLVTASKTPRRDRLGYFIPLISVRAALLSVDPEHAPVRSMAELLERKELRVALVRGFDYGEQYQALVQELVAQGRVFIETDVLSVARLLNAGFADVTIMPPATLAGGLPRDPRVQSIMDKLRVELLEDLPWRESGIYVSKTTVRAGDRAQLEHMFNAAVKSGAVWDVVRKHYPPALVEGTLRPH